MGGLWRHMEKVVGLGVKLRGGGQRRRLQPLLFLRYAAVLVHLHILLLHLPLPLLKDLYDTLCNLDGRGAWGGSFNHHLVLPILNDLLAADDIHVLRLEQEQEEGGGGVTAPLCVLPQDINSLDFGCCCNQQVADPWRHGRLQLIADPLIGLFGFPLAGGGFLAGA